MANIEKKKLEKLEMETEIKSEPVEKPEEPAPTPIQEEPPKKPKLRRQKTIRPTPVIVKIDSEAPTEPETPSPLPAATNLPFDEEAFANKVVAMFLEKTAKPKRVRNPKPKPVSTVPPPPPPPPPSHSFSWM